MGVQDLLDNPNLGDPAQTDSYLLCKYVGSVASPRTPFTNLSRNDPTEYAAKVRRIAEANKV